MEEQGNPIKKILYREIEKLGEKKIQNEIASENFEGLINTIVEKCHNSILNIEGNPDSNIATLLTGILHYILTNSLIPSQRKIEQNEIYLDIIVPDLKTLLKNPGNSLIILLPENQEKIFVESRIDQITKIQPHKENIWVVQNKKSDINCKTFTLEEKKFPTIINEIKQFLAKHKQTQFKIFKN